MEDKDIVITSAFRTPIGSYMGSLSAVKATELGTEIIKSCMKNSELNGDDVDMVYMGQVLQTGSGQNPARQAAMNAGINKEKTATTINQVCGSGLSAISLGFNSLKLDDGNIIIAGGQESMSNSPYYINLKKDEEIDKKKLQNSMMVDGLIDSYNHYHMGVTAENIAEKYQITRADQDKFALNSQKKAINAIDTNKFKDEVIPIKINGKLILEKDEYPRKDTNIEKLSSLKTVFKDGGTVTAGNASGLNDGAAANVLKENSKNIIENFIILQSIRHRQVMKFQ